MTASTPYGRSDGSCRNVTPFALSSSYVLRQSSTCRADSAHGAGLELSADELGGVGRQRRSRLHQGQVELGLARVADGDPAELTQGGVAAQLEPELVDVEVAGLVLIETVDGGD
jgi:hypothetical protein